MIALRGVFKLIFKQLPNLPILVDGINNLKSMVHVPDALMMFAGLRYSEQIALRLGDVDVGDDPAAAGGVGGADFRSRN